MNAAESTAPRRPKAKARKPREGREPGGSAYRSPGWIAAILTAIGVLLGGIGGVLKFILPEATGSSLPSQGRPPIEEQLPSKGAESEKAAETRQPPPGALRITVCRVLVKGPGKDPDNEEITLCNRDSAPAHLEGWYLEDNSGRYYLRELALQPGASWTVQGREFNPTRNSRGLFLNNDQDRVRLVDPGGRVVDECSWPPRTRTATCEKSWT